MDTTRSTRLINALHALVEPSLPSSEDDYPTLLEQAGPLVGAAAVGIETPVPDGDARLRVTCASDARVRAFVANVGGRPCPSLLAYTTASPVAASQLTVHGPGNRWPHLAPAAAATGLTSLLAAPVRSNDEVTAVLVCYRTAPAAFSDDDRHVLQILITTFTALSTCRRTIADQRTTIAQLQGALISRTVIEQAKGALAERWGTTPDMAFEQLRAYARSHRQRLHHIADSVLDGTLALQSPPT